MKIVHFFLGVFFFATSIHSEEKREPFKPSDKLKYVDFKTWLNRAYEEREPAYPGQYEHSDRDIKYITFHYTVTKSGDRDTDKEQKILRDSVQKSALYITPQKPVIRDGKKTWPPREHKGKPIPNLGKVAYHFLIGNSGTVYQGRPLHIAPASNTFYFPGGYFQAEGGNYINSAMVDDLVEKEKQKKKTQEEKSRVVPELYIGRLISLQNLEKNKTDFDDRKDVGEKLWKQHRGTSPTGGDVIRSIAPGASAGHLTISFIGNNLKEHKPTPAAYEAAARLCAELLDHYDLETKYSIRVHREVSTTTTCPGPYVYEWLRTAKKDNNHTGRGSAYDQINSFRKKKNE